ncbi:glycerol transporter [Xylographa opegraphella]|nr:glycerol transporter [Xylographa opegraphella]
MSLLHYAQKLFSLDTLDTRFTTSSRAPSKTTDNTQLDPAKSSTKEAETNARQQSGGKSTALQDAVSPALWRTPEFYSYYVIFLVCVPLMFKAVYDISKPSHPNYQNYVDLLSPGWISGRMVDNSDNQYSTFRDNVPYMFILVVVHPLLRRLYEAIYPLKDMPPKASPMQEQKSNSTFPLELAQARMKRRVTFDFYFALIFLCALHGFSALKVLFILYTNFLVAKRVPRQYVVAATWIFNIGILFANELGKGYPYSTIATSILPWSATPDVDIDGKSRTNWGSTLDTYGGLVPRWEILFNITVLRLISFNLDYTWSLDRERSSPVEKKQLDLANLSDRERIDTPAQHQDYSFRNYLAYVLYSPLYLAGPIITFNDYISQAHYTPRSVTTRRTIMYGVRFLICLLTMEVMLHFIYAIAISKAQPAWEVYTPFQLSMLGYFNLHLIWLKLLLPWRFFRFWALLDGVDPPENMVRCMSDNYSTLAFWRAWHRSFNQWIVRYLYIPLGGSGRSQTRSNWDKIRAGLNFLAVFMFVALWHDIQLRVLMWGWLISLFVLPEVLAGFLFPKKRWQSHKTAYRWICGVGAVGNILMMMAANLVGFAVGLDGLQGLVHGIVGSYSGLVFLATACVALFVGVQVMFETRAEEQRQGIRMKC